MEHEKGKGRIRHAIEATLKMWNLDSSNFHLSLEDKLRQPKQIINQ